MKQKQLRALFTAHLYPFLFSFLHCQFFHTSQHFIKAVVMSSKHQIKKPARVSRQPSMINHHPPPPAPAPVADPGPAPTTAPSSTAVHAPGVVSDRSSSSLLSASVDVDVRENKDIKTLEDAKLVTRSRAKFLFSLRDGDLMTRVVTQSPRDVVWQILMSFDDWKQWQFDVSTVLIEEKYPETAALLIGRCFASITNESGEAIFKLSRNLLSSLAQFCTVNSAFSKATNQTNTLNDILDFLSKTEVLLPNQDGKKILLIKICLRLPLLLWFYSPQAWQIVEWKFVKSDNIKTLPAYIEMIDDECRCLVYIWLLRLAERNKAIANCYGDIGDVIPLFVKLLNTCLEKNDTDFVAWLIHELFVVTRPTNVMAGKVTNNAELVTDFGKSLQQLVTGNQSAFHESTVLQRAQQMLLEISPPFELPGEWKPMTFKLNGELKTADEYRAENIVRVSFLNKLYQLSPDSLVCLDAALAISLFCQSRYMFKEMSDDWKNAFENVLLQENFVDIALKYNKVLIKQHDLDKEALAYEMAESLHRLFWNMTNASEAIRTAMAKCGYVEFYLEILKDVNGLTSKCSQSEHYNYILSSTISTLYNTSRSPKTKHKFLALDAANSLVPYLDPKYGKLVQTSLCIAYVVSDTPEASRLAAEKGIIKTVVTMANEAAQSRDKKANINGSIWSLSELLDGLCVLATNDGNKTKLMENGVIGLVEQLLSKGSDVEKLRGIDLIWALSFDATAKAEIKTKHQNDIIKPLQELTKSQNKDIESAAKKAVMYIEKWDSIEQQSNNNKTGEQPSTSASGGSGHIFLSYSWKQQETVLLIRQELLSRNFKVWMDVDKMHGGLLDAMAKAVEDASLVVICFSQSYKESNPCRAEAQYAYTLGRTIIPVNMEYHYQADGWLGIIVRPLKYTDMSLKKRPFEAAMQLLLTEIQINFSSEPSTTLQTEVGNKTNKPSAETEQQREHGSLVLPSSNQQNLKMTENSVVGNNDINKKPSVKPPKYAKWTNAEVVKWLKQENVNKIFESKMQRFDGEKLWTLIKIRDQAPEFFYQALKEHVGTSLPDLLDLIAAIDRLTGDEI